MLNDFFEDLRLENWNVLIKKHRADTLRFVIRGLFNKLSHKKRNQILFSLLTLVALSDFVPSWQECVFRHKGTRNTKNHKGFPNKISSETFKFYLLDSPYNLAVINIYIRQRYETTGY
jgi:hypothetical protein